MTNIALLVLEDGTVYVGTAWGATGLVVGDADFTTEMIGYQRPMTDPEKVGRILVMTTPHVGIGAFDENDDAQITPAGLVVREPARPHPLKKRRELVEQLQAENVIGIAGVDTRAITRRIRAAGSMRAAIVSGQILPASAAYLEGRSRESLDLNFITEQFQAGQAGADTASTFDLFIDSMCAAKADHLAAERTAL
ncbi:carbamoyl-phosphate synthase domain-containing protein [Schaalia vaccimaxillae]|uniref:carbamoyl-phosphate synthase domain-containing protein n=1 Tax=Schaalia vaccimaxillae TaxID=183916 RepID=UPI0003B4DFEE|nr:carbamoyl-phosphate synthase domain-containing protein [Schaalia vaccimaxillae]